ncbi:competence protein CoiA family protein [Coleofasciculus sp. G2-EDA-02]|uniref:competence protein CoiA family protein n=1 Tax=Coleofasciculus sp. G2-EDA-02 TaxID=3069529 RepID=UPI0032F31412
MWLKYGVSADNALMSIEDVPSGKTNLTCLYCGGGLTAKKGKVKQHHFAHTDETCYPVAKKQVPTLPLYDNFNIELSGKELEELKVLWKNYGVENYEIFVKPSLKLILSKLLTWNERGCYEFTNFGKIPVGALPLSLFNEVQEPLLLKKLSQLEQAAERAKIINSRYLPERVADLRLYGAQYKRIL